MRPLRFTLSRLLHNEDGMPTEVTVTDLPTFMHMHKHITDPKCLYRLTDNVTGGRWMASLDEHTAMIEVEPLGPKRFSPEETRHAMALVGATLQGAA